MDTLSRASAIDPSGYHPVATGTGAIGGLSAPISLIPTAPRTLTICTLPMSVVAPHVAQQQSQVANLPCVAIPMTSSIVTRQLEIKENALHQ